VVDDDVDLEVAMLDLSGLDLDEIAAALADQSAYDHRWMIDPRTGEIVLWTVDCDVVATAAS
jgi:hypothetical protein